MARTGDGLFIFLFSERLILISYRTLDALSQSLDECRAVLKRLYPAHDIQSLVSLSQHELLAILDRPAPTSTGSHSPSTTSHTSPLSQDFQSPIASTTISSDDRSLANLEQVPSQDTEWDEERRDRDPIPVEADDVNALSLSVDRQSSYLGASSIKAALLVMLKVAPVLRSFLAPAPLLGRQLPNSYNTETGMSSQRCLQRIAWTSEGQTLIDAYFNRVQVAIPMLDEPSFRAVYLAGQRNDASWLALLNMVFAMGSIAAMKSDDNTHVIFYNRAKEHLGLDSFGSGHIEALQALALMGGYYLHYINRPNMANAILGAALRMAIAMGIHRESPVNLSNKSPSGRHNLDSGALVPAEVRRRTWWSLFCLDTWASTTLGRPSLGRDGAAITVLPPTLPSGPTPHHAPPENLTQDDLLIQPLISNILFARIATRIQDTLALSPLPKPEERLALDAALVDWYANLPSILHGRDPCPESVYTARCVMKWRYQNLRIVLHRPVLLNLANRAGQRAACSFGAEKDEVEAVETCRAIARETIGDIAVEWGRNQMSGWNAVWFLYQAAMIPLVSIFWEAYRNGLAASASASVSRVQAPGFEEKVESGMDEESDEVKEWRRQIVVVLELFEAMAEWSLAARRSREVVGRMFEASIRPGHMTRHSSPMPSRAPCFNALLPHPNYTADATSTSPSAPTAPLQNYPAWQHHQTAIPHPHMTAHGARTGNNENVHAAWDRELEMHEDIVLGDHQSIWDLDGMLWGNLPDGLDMPFDGMPGVWDGDAPYGFSEGMGEGNWS